MKKHLLALFLLSGCASAPTTPATAVNKGAEGDGRVTRARSAEMDAKEKETLAQEVRDEITVGRLMAAKLAGQFGTYSDDPALTEYVNQVGQTLAQQSGRPELKYYFGILDTEELNAFATPGGYIFVTKGLLKTLKTEAELAGVLGHEIAHINEKHMYDAIRPKKKEVSTGETLSRLLGRGGSELGLSVSKMVNDGLGILLEKGYEKEKEYGADSAGVIYTSLAGYDPHSLTELLKRIESSKGTVKISKTHPPYGERISTLSSFLDNNGIAKGGRADTKVLDARFQGSTSKLKK